MTKRTFTGKGGETWEWEETPEVVEALKQLHKTSVESKIKRPHNYEGPLYASHPDLKKISKLESEAPDYGVGK